MLMVNNLTFWTKKKKYQSQIWITFKRTFFWLKERKKKLYILKRSFNNNCIRWVESLILTWIIMIFQNSIKHLHVVSIPFLNFLSCSLLIETIIAQLIAPNCQRTKKNNKWVEHYRHIWKSNAHTTYYGRKIIITTTTNILVYCLSQILHNNILHVEDSL